MQVSSRKKNFACHQSDIYYRLAVKAGTFGAILEYGVEEKVFATTLVGFDCQPLGDEPVQCVRHHAGWVSSWGHMQAQAHKVRGIPNWKLKKKK